MKRYPPARGKVENPPIYYAHRSMEGRTKAGEDWKRVGRKVLQRGAGWKIFVREAQADEAGVCVFAKVLVILRTD